MLKFNKYTICSACVCGVLFIGVVFSTGIKNTRANITGLFDQCPVIDADVKGRLALKAHQYRYQSQYIEKYQNIWRLKARRYDSAAQPHKIKDHLSALEDQKQELETHFWFDSAADMQYVIRKCHQKPHLFMCSEARIDPLCHVVPALKSFTDGADIDLKYLAALRFLRHLKYSEHDSARAPINQTMGVTTSEIISGILSSSAEGRADIDQYAHGY